MQRQFRIFLIAPVAKNYDSFALMDKQKTHETLFKDG